MTEQEWREKVRNSTNYQRLERLTGQCKPDRSNTLTGAYYDTRDYSGEVAQPTTSIDFSKGTAVPFEDILSEILGGNGQPTPEQVRWAIQMIEAR